LIQDNDDGFDIAQFMKNYDAKRRKEIKDSNNRPRNLTLADLPRPDGRPSIKTFIKDSY
jgi:hypothetical protein